MPAPALFRTDDDVFAPRALLGWVGFSLAAGGAIAGALLACRDVLGGAARAAADGGRAPFALGCALVLAAFVAGATLAALAAETWVVRRELGFALPLVLSSAALLGVAFSGRAGAFGAFGGPGGGAGPAPCLALLGAVAAAAGLLNSSVSLATSKAVRATPSAGAVADLVTGLVRAALGSGEERAHELRWALLRAVKLAAFAAGGALAAANSGRLQYDLFAAAAAVLVVALGLTAAPGDELPEASARVEAPVPAGAPRAGAPRGEA